MRAFIHASFVCIRVCVCVCEPVYAGDSLYRYWVNALPTAENEATAMRMLPTASENTVNSVSVNKRTTHTHTHVRIATPTHTHTYIYIHIKRGRTARSFCNVYNSNMEPAGGGSSGRAMHFRRGTPTYRQIHTKIRCNRTHTYAQREKYIYKCMYISEMPHWGRNVAALYIHTHTQIHIHIFITWKMLSKEADGLGSQRSWSRGGRQGAAARVVCVPLSHLKH